jgi:hypothetical protein
MNRNEHSFGSRLVRIRERLFPAYNPRRIIVTGWPASGSTFLYQVAKHLGLEVKKSHGRRKKTIDFTLFTFRDPRDIICSQARRVFASVWDGEGPEAALLKALDLFIDDGNPRALYDSVTMQNVFFIRYEDYFLGNEHLLVNLIADNFLIPVDEHRKQTILNSTSIQANIERAQKYNSFDEYDDQTKVHGGHVSNMGQSGAWKVFFTPLVRRRAREALGPLLVDLGYEEDLNSAD